MRAHAFGGFTYPESGPPGWNPVSDAWEYDAANDAWRVLAPMPTARGGGVAAVVGGKLYVIGGAGATLGASSGTILGMVLRETSLLIALGLAIGTPAALLSGRLIRSRLYGLDLADPRTLEVALRNLLGNAVKFTERGSAGVRARLVPGAVSVEVWDTGPGLPEGLVAALLQVGEDLTDRQRSSVIRELQRHEAREAAIYAEGLERITRLVRKNKQGTRSRAESDDRAHEASSLPSFDDL